MLSSGNSRAEVASSHQSGQLVVTSAEPVDEAAVIAAVEEAGYQVVRSA